MSLHESFNRSAFSQFINGPTGRIFRLVAGAGFLAFGYAYRGHALGLLSMAWSVLPLSAGAFDVCYISAALGGPFSGARIRGLTRGAGPPSARSSDEASLARPPGSGAHDHPAAR